MFDVGLSTFSPEAFTIIFRLNYDLWILPTTAGQGVLDEFSKPEKWSPDFKRHFQTVFVQTVLKNALRELRNEGLLKPLSYSDRLVVSYCETM